MIHLQLRSELAWGRVVLTAVSLALVLTVLPAAVPAAPTAVLVWADDEAAVSATGPHGTKLAVSIGMALPAGSTVSSGSSGLELRLEPNGSRIRIAPSTVFRIDALTATGASGKNTFSLVAGKVRMLATPAAGQGGYEVRTGSAVCAVRGTDFARQYDPGIKKDWLCVLEGKVEIQPATGGAGTMVSGGQFVSQAKAWVPEPPPAGWIEANLSDLAFRSAP